MILDAGFLISVDRGDQAARDVLRVALDVGRELHTTAPIIAQVWRNGTRQARLARFLKGVTVHEFDTANGRHVGELLGLTNSSDVVDAHLVVVARSFSLDVLTSDPDDIGPLADAIAAPTPVVKAWP